jgi:hypothetical protein
MKIELKVPDWAEKRGLHIFAGIERVAYKMPWEEHWHIKTERCSMCGRCCKKVACEYLEKEPGNNTRWLCGKPLMMPYSCLISKPRNVKECKMKFKEAK